MLESKDFCTMPKRIVQLGIATSDEILERYESIVKISFDLEKIAITKPKITSAQEVIQPLAPINNELIQTRANKHPIQEQRESFFSRLPEEERPRHMALLLNRALGDILIDYPNSIIFGEDVGKKRRSLSRHCRPTNKSWYRKGFNTPLDETSILGLAIGWTMGMLPIPEIQYLAYLHNAVDQIRGEVCSQQFFSKGQIFQIHGCSYCFFFTKRIWRSLSQCQCNCFHKRHTRTTHRLSIKWKGCCSYASELASQLMNVIGVCI